MGYPVPIKISGSLSAVILVIVGIFVIFVSLLWIVTGLMVFIWLWFQGKQYERDLNVLVAKRIDSGSPSAE